MKSLVGVFDQSLNQKRKVDLDPDLAQKAEDAKFY
jgi:hypothetical protein